MSRLRGIVLLLVPIGAPHAIGCAEEPASSGMLVFTMLDSPAPPGSGEPNVVAGEDGRLHLSWIERDEGGPSVLWFATREGSGWSRPRTIAQGDDWFVNWADFPSLAALPEGTLAAHWLEKNGEGTYAYDVRISFSGDGGRTWDAAIVPHRDGTETEHGFVSLLPWSGGRLSEVDGNATNRRAERFTAEGVELAEKSLELMQLPNQTSASSAISAVIQVPSCKALART